MKRIILLSMAIFLILMMSASFADANSPSDWAQASIDELMSYGEFDEGIFTDYQEGITRLEFIYLATKVYELLDGEEIVIDPSISFEDTSDEYALKGASIGLTTGIGDNKFGTDQLLTREQLATFMMRILSLLNLEVETSTSEKFADDAEISNWAKEAIYLAKTNEIISGVEDNKINPKGTASKEMAMVIANRLLKNNAYKEAVETVKSKYDMSSIVFWTTVADQDVTKSIVNKAKAINRVYMDSGSIHIGGENNMNIDPLNVYLPAPELLSFQITGSSQPGVKETIEDLLKLWTLDGQYIYDVLTLDAKGYSNDEWWTAPNGTEVMMSDEGIGYWIYIKKSSMFFNEAYEQEVLARGISTEYKNKEMDMSWVNSTAGQNHYKTVEEAKVDAEAVLSLIEEVNQSNFRQTHGLRADYWDTAGSQEEFLAWLDRLPEAFDYVVDDRNNIEILYKYQSPKYSVHARFVKFNPRSYLSGYRDKGRYISFSSFSINDYPEGIASKAFMKFSLSLLTDDYEAIYNDIINNTEEIKSCGMNNQPYERTIGDTNYMATLSSYYIKRVETTE